MSPDINMRARQPKFILPLLLIGIGAACLAGWRWLDPLPVAIRYIEVTHSRFLLGSRAVETITRLLAALRVLGLLALALGLLAALVAWLRPRLAGSAAVFAFSALAYAASSGPFLTEQSFAPHFVYLADAFAHGRVFLDFTPPYSEEGDWTYYDGKWTVSFPPLPAVLMTPFVALRGKEFNDVLFTLLFGALNVALAYDLAGRLGPHAAPPGGEPAGRVALALLFGFGTVHWWVASVGQVWFTAQIVALTFLLLALREALAAYRGGTRRPLLVGSWLALAALGRPTMLLALPVLVWLLAPGGVAQPARRRGWLLLGVQMALPLALAGGFMAWFNYLRFGNPLDLGYGYMKIEKLLAGPLLQHGQFSLAFLGKNLHYAFLALPRWIGRWPYLQMDVWGLSMFLSTPALLYAFRAPWREKLAQAMALGALLVALPSLLYYNTGYMQAGYRFILDFLPFLFVLIGLGMRGRLTIASAALIGISILMGYLSLVNFYYMSLGLF